MTKPTHVDKFTPDTLEWKITPGLEMALMHQRHFTTTTPANGEISLTYYKTEISLDFNPVFVFMNTKTRKPERFGLAMAMQLTKGLPN